MVVAIQRKLHFYNTSTCKEYAPVITAADDLTAPAILCPMGVFLVYGSSVANIRAYAGPAKAYLPYFVAGNASDPWTLQQSAIAVNGGPTNPDGCLLTLAWLRDDGLQIRVDLFSLLTKKLLWSWLSPENQPGFPTSVTGIVAYMFYVAVSTAGGPTIPELLVFSRHSTQPVYEYQSYGLTLGTDLFMLTPTRVAVAAFGARLRMPREKQRNL